MWGEVTRERLGMDGVSGSGAPGRAGAADGREFEVANRLFFRLYQCSNLLHKNGTRHVERFGATTQQWAVLGALTRPLVRVRGMSVKDLIGFLMLSRQNLTAVLDRLEARGWIERVKAPEDGRARLIRLTEEGERMWAQMQESIAAFYAAALAPLDPAERKQLVIALEHLRNGLSRA